MSVYTPQIFLAFALLTVSIPQSLALVRVTPEEGAKITQCLQKEFTAESTREPKTSQMSLGETWQCTKIMYLKSPEAYPNDLQILVKRDAPTEYSYLFKKETWGVHNYEGTARGSQEKKVQYLSFNDGGIDGILGIAFPIKQGWFWDFMRVNSKKELITEESIFEFDLPNYIVSERAPKALVLEKQIVYSYSVCQPTSVFAQRTVPSCFQDYLGEGIYE